MEKRVALIQSGLDRPTIWNKRVKTIFFDIYLLNTVHKIGECDLRIGMNEELFYAGNIGYRIYSGWRGHHYAEEACHQLIDIAKNEYHLNELVITCSPDNEASRKTIVRCGGLYKKTVDVPYWHWLYKRGEKVKEIYYLNLGEEDSHA